MARGTLRIALGVVGAGALSVGVWFGVRAMQSGGEAKAVVANASRDAMAPEGVRIRVQVVNATTTRGLARRATQVLRDRGFDVVESGTATEQRDSTLVLDRSGHPDWANRVALALGGARVEARPDSSRYLDVTVLVGRSWRPPTQPFYP